MIMRALFAEELTHPQESFARQVGRILAVEDLLAVDAARRLWPQLQSGLQDGLFAVEAGAVGMHMDASERGPDVGKRDADVSGALGFGHVFFGEAGEEGLFSCEELLTAVLYEGCGQEIAQAVVHSILQVIRLGHYNLASIVDIVKRPLLWHMILPPTKKLFFYSNLV